MNAYNVIGIMSGTSLDGLDICYCNFILSNNNKWKFNIKNTSTIKYSSDFEKRLSTAKSLNGLDLMILHNELGNLPVICDFRSTDVALGGQGAPLVPIGDELLFSNYDYCINLGGIANISYKKDKQRIAFDICPVNMVLNYLSQKIGFNYDDKGKMASKGKTDKELLDKLNKLNYYKNTSPKSLGIEWIEKEIFPLLNTSKISFEDQLSTFVAHIVLQISKTISGTNKKIIITGGGAYNTYLIEQLNKATKNQIIIPSKEIIEFKEALIFAFLGVLRWRKEPNCLKSVTEAKNNNVGGCIYQAF